MEIMMMMHFVCNKHTT